MARRSDRSPASLIDTGGSTWPMSMASAPGDGHTVAYGLQIFYPGLCTLPGQPSTAFPVGFDEDGLPIGLQAIGPYLEDHTPLHFVELLERAELSKFVPPKNYQ